MVAMRATEFKEQALNVPNTVKDSRFGIRNLPVSTEEPTMFSYATPGRGVSGESSN
jgi:hypothetical protein